MCSEFFGGPGLTNKNHMGINQADIGKGGDVFLFGLTALGKSFGTNLQPWSFGGAKPPSISPRSWSYKYTQGFGSACLIVGCLGRDICYPVIMGT